MTIDDHPFADDFETRLTDFTHLVASSIDNVNARDSLIASRARIVSASDDTRRQIERNLHDGVQQRMVALAFKLRAARIRSPLPSQLQAGLDEIAADLEGVQEEIRVFSQGLHPVLLARHGLGTALRDLIRRSSMTVELQLRLSRRFAEPVETAVYYVVSEALTNAAKHAHASVVSVHVLADDTTITARIVDDGVGGASANGGSGLIGLADRIEAIGGQFALSSPVGKGTTIAIQVALTDSGRHPEV